MQDRHTNRQRYFQEQIRTTEKFVIPFIEKVKPVKAGMNVVEIGCGEAGNLGPFLERGCTTYGIDISESKIQNASKYYENHPERNNLHLITCDIYKVAPSDLPRFDIVIMRDTLEHIPDQEKFLGQLKKFMAPDGVIFNGFPPWRMPFGGHQQICSNKLFSKLPYWHLMPRPIFVSLAKLAGEPAGRITELLEIRDTGISINKYRRIVRSCGYKMKQETLFLFNPNYETKFGVKPRRLPFILNLPWLRDFFTTAHYSLLTL
ncbi:MAG: class I SAM-dependent methyltransferase [Flavobacteriales bacterium]|nr:class I SAM-dependent methyltransferase [Flavobacteriales bacterium]MCB9447874.1 class I SAM-dependent methyltransferase [Flavobacteriales bacterium]